jgi:hypothetical protein
LYGKGGTEDWSPSIKICIEKGKLLEKRSKYSSSVEKWSASLLLSHLKVSNINENHTHRNSDAHYAFPSRNLNLDCKSLEILYWKSLVSYRILLFSV